MVKTVTIDIINEKALKLLQDLEQLQLIRVRKDNSNNSHIEISSFKGSMSKQPLLEIEKQLNIVIYFLQQHLTPSAEVFIDKVLEESTPCISAITEIELLCWRTVNDNDMEVLLSFISEAEVIELEKSIKIKTAEIRKANKIKLPDAIIAATAIVFDLTLLTRNTSDFKNILGLKLIDPMQIV
jgi:predicted nucleic acid-binding protein